MILGRKNNNEFLEIVGFGFGWNNNIYYDPTLYDIKKV